MATKDSASIRIGQHWIADLRGVDAAILKDEVQLMAILKDALCCAGFTILHTASHKFPAPGEGVTGFVLLSESHASFHTYPEHAYLAFDLFSCGSSDGEQVLDAMIETLQPAEVDVNRQTRTA